MPVLYSGSNVCGAADILGLAGAAAGPEAPVALVTTHPGAWWRVALVEDEAGLPGSPSLSGRRSSSANPGWSPTGRSGCSADLSGAAAFSPSPSPSATACPGYPGEYADLVTCAHELAGAGVAGRDELTMVFGTHNGQVREG